MSDLEAEELDRAADRILVLKAKLAKAQAEIERLRGALRSFGNCVETLALSMPPPNIYTPQFIQAVETARAALREKP